ncbi:MAG: RluA family pseudouridine synthase [Verrucomicrobia bacterium]|nr:RluA family pseudouridine synthase [Verrucomicrobiota bacterium]
MPKIFKVKEVGPLLKTLFAAWPAEKKKQIRTWLKFQAITVNGRPVSQFDHPLKPGDQVAVRTDRFAAPKTRLPSGLKIYFEDAHLLVVEKPEGLLSISSPAEPEKTAYFQLTEYLRHKHPRSRERVWIVHRLDRETSGLMVFAKTAPAKEVLQSNWDTFEKRYEAVVEGRLPAQAGVLESDLDESNPHHVAVRPKSERTRHAITRYRILKTSPQRSLVELTLETGRRHQIRVQLAHAGCPVVGDEKYGAKSDPAGRLGLHACFLRFRHPVTGAELRFTSPLPKPLARLV